MISSHATKWQWNHILETKDANHHPRSQLASRRGKDSQSFCSFFLALPPFFPNLLGVGNSSKWHRSALSKLLKTCWNPGTLRFCATWCDFWPMFCCHRKPSRPDDLSNHFPTSSITEGLHRRCFWQRCRRVITWAKDVPSELGSDRCMRQCLGRWMFCIYSYFWCIISLLVLFFACKFTSIDTKKSKKGQTSLQNKNVSLAYSYFPVSEKIYYIKKILLCALLAWLGWAFAWPAHAKPNVACRQMWAAVCFFLTTGGKPVWGSIFDSIWLNQKNMFLFRHWSDYLQSQT